MAWVYLLLGGFFEVMFTTSLRYVDGFKNLPWTLAFIVFVSLSMWFLNLAVKYSIPLGTAYAVWTGIGAFGTVLIGIIWFQEPASLIRILLLIGLVGCVAGLKFTSAH